MNDLKELLDREARRVSAEPDALDTVLRRRDRKRRNQRITAGVVGMAVFVAAVWVVTSGLSPDRSERSVAPAGEVTGPTQNAPPAAPDAGWDGQGLPPKGTALSTPVEGELIRSNARRCPFPFFCTPFSVYADGRVLWGVGGTFGEGVAVIERRLTAQSVDLVRSGVIRVVDLKDRLHGVPPSAWADADFRPYAPPMYSICFSPDPSAVMRPLPAAAEALLRRNGLDPSHGRCLQVTTAEARALDEIMSEAGFVPEESGWAAAGWFLREGDRVRIELLPLLPDGRQLWGSL